MKRSPMPKGKPLERGSKPLARRTPLRQVSSRDRFGEVPVTGGPTRAPLRRTATPLRRTARLPRQRASATPRAAPRPKADPVTPATRAAVHERSGGYCEARTSRGCRGVAQHVHHRKLRRHGDHTLENLLDVCVTCHNEIHDHTGRAYRRGLLVRANGEPSAVPVVAGY